MRKRKFTEEQIMGILKEHQAGDFGDGCMPEARDLGRDVLHVAVQVRRPGGFSRQAAEDAR